jgi:two-component system sensor histidine kinase MprB
MPGAGLGLAIVKQAVLKHGGTLEVEDTVPGGDPSGTSFRIVLPGRRVLPESATATAPFQVPTGPSPTRGDKSMDATSSGADNR